MDSRSHTPTTNIVAAAISTANIALSPGSPKNISSLSANASNINVQSSHIPMVSSPAAQRVKSPQLCNAESMDVTEHHPPTRVLHRQQSQDSDTPSQRSMDSNQTITPSPYRVEEPDGTVVMRTDGKDPYLVTVTPPMNPYPITSVNGDARLQHLIVCTSASDKTLMTPVPMNMQFLTKADSIESESRPKPKDDATYPITCGNNKAELVWKKFICPGINAKCVKCADSWFTPKEFVNYAGKSTLKDWKRAIRINGVMLRKMIENGELNYFEHETNCSNQCRSNKSSSFDNSCDKSGANSFESDTRENPKEPYDYGSIRSSSEDLTLLANKKINLPALHHAKSQESSSGLQAGQSLERSSSEDSGLAASPHIDSMLLRETPVTVEKIQDLNNFWNGVLRMDLFDDIIRDVMIQVTNLQSRTRSTGAIGIEDVVTMTNLVNSLEMIPSISSKISIHKRKVDKDTEESGHAIQELEKKLAEQKRYEQDLKRKSQHLENVISLTPTEKRQKRIYRMCRQKAVDARVPPAAGGSSSSPVPSSLRENAMLGSVTGRASLGQRELWPQAIQVDANARAASSQMARMNVSGSSAQSAIPGIPSFAIFSPPHSFHTNPDVYSSPSLHQVFVSSQAHHASRESTQSPKK